MNRNFWPSRSKTPRESSVSKRPSITVDRIVLVVGFALTIAGVFGTQIYLAPQSDLKTKLSSGLDETWTRLKIIRGAQALFNLIESSDGMVYLVHPDFDHDRDKANLITELTNRQVHGRHDATRNYFAQVASAGEADFLAANRRYDELVDAETKNWSLESYSRTNKYPADLNMKVGQDRWPIEMSVWGQERALRSAIAETQRRGNILCAINAVGAAFLFALALAAIRERRAPPAAAPPIDKAADLIALALSQARHAIDERRRSA
jgi:hypothetical protein